MPTRANAQPGPGPLLAAGASLLLIVSLFLDWFESPGGGDVGGISGWTVFEIHDLLLTALALAALWRAAHALGALREGHAVPLWMLGAPALVIVASQLINHPPAATGAEIAIGGWLALVAAIALLASGLLNRVRVSLVENHEPTTGAAPVTPRPAAAPASTPASNDPTQPTRPL